MVIELEFLNENKERLHEEDMRYEGVTPPIPNVGESVLLKGNQYIVKRRDFIYLSGSLGIDIRVSMWCKDPRDKKDYISFD